MRRLIYIIVLALVFSVTSCTIETSDNGDLDGFWHLERVDTIATGGVCDVRNNKVFWGVGGKLMQIDTDKAHYFFRFNQTGDSLIVNTPYINVYDLNRAGQGADSLLTDPAPLHNFGIEGLEVHYKKTIKGSRMMLQSPSLVLYFKKF